MRFFLIKAGLWTCLSAFAVAQQSGAPADSDPLQGQAPPRNEQSLDHSKEAGDSSSRDSRIDLSPPKDDEKTHPGSGSAVSDALTNSSSDTNPSTSEGVQEFHPWDPYKAAKSVEVGDYYFRRKNYRAALSRYREALTWKSNDAVANFRTAQCQEKLNDPDQAALHYAEYLKILPHGPFSSEARKALVRLGAEEAIPPADAEPEAPKTKAQATP